MARFDIQDFEADLQITAKSEAQATQAVLALEKLFRVIDAETIIHMEKVIREKNTMGMISLANKIISGKK